MAKKCRTPAPITDRVIHDETKCLRHAVDLACCKPADQPARRDRRIRGDATCRSDAGSRRQRRLAGVVRGSAWRSRRYRRRARGNRIEMKRVSHPYGRSVPVTTISTGSAAAPGAHKPGVPIRASSGRRSARPFPRDRARPDAGNRGTRRSAAVVLPRHCRGSFLLCPAKIGGYPSQDRLTFRRQPPVPTLEFSPTPSPTFRRALSPS